jgi:hypothetical protein
MQQLAQSNGHRPRYADGHNQGTSSQSAPTLKAVTCGSSPTSSEYQENTRLDVIIDAAILLFGILLVALLHLVAGELRPSWWAFVLIATSWAISLGIVRVLR